VQVKNATRIDFPNIVAVLGGAEYALAGKRDVLVKVPGWSPLVRLRRAALPLQIHWTAFNLADAAAAEIRRTGKVAS